MSVDGIASNDRMRVNDEFEWIWKEAISALEVISPNLLEEPRRT
jgi:hypothetical protein